MYCGHCDKLNGAKGKVMNTKQSRMGFVLGLSRTAVMVLLFLCAYTAADAQDVARVTQGKLTYRPVVKNNRILWFETREVNQSIGRVSVYVYENGANKLITNDASALFPGWPDLDDDGSVVYMRNMGTSHQVFLYNGITGATTQITNNPAVRDSTIDMGLGTDKVYTGFARIHGGDIVFKDQLGHVYLYRSGGIRRITRLATQTANLGDDDPQKGSTGISAPLNAHVKYFEFDGRHIVWMHEERGSGNRSNVSLFMAKAAADPRSADHFAPRAIASFEAWVPNDKAIPPGKVNNPFFKACNGVVVWQYYTPASPTLPAGVSLPGLLKDYTGANIDDTRVWIYDGAAREISRGAFVDYQSVRVHNGKVVWAQLRKEGSGYNVTKYDEVVMYDGLAAQTIASYREPPSQANLNETFWDNILDVEIVGEDVFWLAGQTQCFQQVNLLGRQGCMYRPTKDIGLFRLSTSSSVPFTVTDSETFAGGGEMDRGVFAFFSGRASLTRDISVMNIYGGGSDSAAATQLTVIDRKRPDLKKWRADEVQRKQVTDAFSISFDQIAGCGTASGASEAVIESITLDVLAEKSPTARLEDIKSVTLYSDKNENGRIDEGELVGIRHAPVPTELIFTFTNPGIKIEKDKAKYFFVEMEIKDDVCPCGKYTVSVSGEKLGIRRQGSGTMTGVGRSTGGILLPEAVVTPVSGDEQSGLPNQSLPERLGIMVKNFPIRCGRAKFKISTQPPEKGAAIFSPGNRRSEDEVVFDLTQVGRDARGEVVFSFGSQDGLYTVRASIEMTGGVACRNRDHIFRLHAGKLVVQLIDLNNADYFTAAADSSNPDFNTWKATMTTDNEKLATGGEGREGALADGASMLLVRARLIGFDEAPAGPVNLTILGDGNVGHLSRGLGETIPAYGGGRTVATQWVKTRAGIYAFALYTPPENFGNTTAARRMVELKASYQLPTASSPITHEQVLTLQKPPIAFVHGLWSGPETWGPPYQFHTAQYEVHFIDYAALSSRSFQELGTELKIGIEEIVGDLRRRKIAATRVNVVGHSMGGLVARQHFADDHGARFFRKNNFGKGDIYKLVTLGTPHFGSPVAWLAVTMRDQRYNPFLVVANDLGLDLHGGAIDALCPGSRDLRGLGVTHIPTHTVRAWNFDARTNALSWDDFLMAMTKDLRKVFTDPKTGIRGAKSFNPQALLVSTLKYFGKAGVRVSMASLYASDRTDMLVTVFSQSGGIAPGQNRVFDKTIHFDTGEDLSPYLYSETTSEAVAAYIFDVLNKDRDNIEVFASRLPAPQIQDPGKVCPARP